MLFRCNKTQTRATLTRTTSAILVNPNCGQHRKQQSRTTLRAPVVVESNRVRSTDKGICRRINTNSENFFPVRTRVTSTNTIYVTAMSTSRSLFGSTLKVLKYGYSGSKNNKNQIIIFKISTGIAQSTSNEKFDSRSGNFKLFPHQSCLSQYPLPQSIPPLPLSCC